MIKFLKKHKAVSSETRISQAQLEVETAFNMFKKADETLTLANANLQQVITEERERLAKACLNIERATDELKANNALKVRLSDFVK